MAAKTSSKRRPRERPAKTLVDLRAQREWTFPEFARVLGGRHPSYITRRATPPDEQGEGVIRLPVGDVPYLTDQFSSRLKPRRLVLACDYEHVEHARNKVNR